MRVKDLQHLTLQEAIDNLTAVAEIDLDHPPRIGILRDKRITTSEEDRGAVFWLSGEGSESLIELLDASFRALYLHLLRLCEEPEHNWDNATEQKGIEAMMAVAGEAAVKMEHYLELWVGGKQAGAVTERVEFQELSYLYKNQIRRKWKGTESPAAARGVEEILRDQDYELFFIRNESGVPYYDPSVIREIKITSDFNGENFEEDPLLRASTLRDRDLSASAGQILRAVESEVREFFRMGKQAVAHGLGERLGKAILALYLASNPQNLLQNTNGKSAFQYFHDFHRYLREALRSDAYHHLVAYGAESDTLGTLLLKLAHGLCLALFERPGGVKEEVLGLLHRTMRKGEIPLKGDTFFNQLTIEDEELRRYLAKFPSGPLLKILDLLRVEEEVPFDPMGQENYPHLAFSLLRAHCLSIPCPTRQEMISRAEIVEEFRGFLRGLEEKKKVHLMVNLQDRTSWKEHARCQALEALQKSAEFSSTFQLLTLAKGTDFYHQIHEYEKLDAADDFLETFRTQLKGGESCGFSFPSSIRGKEFSAFLDQLITRVHAHLFQGKVTLDRRERQNFIEITYLLIFFKVMELTKAHFFSFTCKDAIDTGAVETAMLYGFLKILNGGFASEEEANAFRALLYGPALLIRERAVDPERLYRALSALDFAYMQEKHLSALVDFA